MGLMWGFVGEFILAVDCPLMHIRFNSFG